MEITYYAKLLEIGKISRREFIGRAVALGATTALATTMASKALKAATPKKGGHMRIGIGAGSDVGFARSGDLHRQLHAVGRLRSAQPSHRGRQRRYTDSRALHRLDGVKGMERWWFA